VCLGTEKIGLLGVTASHLTSSTNVLDSSKIRAAQVKPVSECASSVWEIKEATTTGQTQRDQRHPTTREPRRRGVQVSDSHTYSLVCGGATLAMSRAHHCKSYQENRKKKEETKRTRTGPFWCPSRTSRRRRCWKSSMSPRRSRAGCSRSRRRSRMRPA